MLNKHVFMLVIVIGNG